MARCGRGLTVARGQDGASASRRGLRQRRPAHVKGYWRLFFINRVLRLRNILFYKTWDLASKVKLGARRDVKILSDREGSTAVRTVGRRSPAYVAQVVADTLIEPTRGYAVCAPAWLVESTVANGCFIRDPGTRDLLGYPSPLRHALGLARRRSRSFETVVLAATSWPENYFHFYTDFLARLAYLDATVDRLESFPVLIHERLARQPFFIDATRHGRLADLQFLPLDAPARAATIIFAHLPYDLAGQSWYLDGPRLLGIPLASQDGTRKIFLDRSPASGRSLTNMDELRPVIESCGFEITRTEGLSLAAQAALCQSARCIAGIHGAGLVNIIWAQGRKLELLEIRPPGVPGRSDFSTICARLGFGHGELFGVLADERLYWHESFSVDPGELSLALQSMTRAGQGDQVTSREAAPHPLRRVPQ